MANDHGGRASPVGMLRHTSLMILAASLILPLSAGCARAQPVAGPEPSNGGVGAENSALADAAMYCSDLKRIAALAHTQGNFASITGKPRDGDFLDTSLPLASWADCSVYGPRSYTCDSLPFTNAAEARNAVTKTASQIRACLGETWAEDKRRSSPDYILLHNTEGSASVTVNTDQTAKAQHVVRLILFLRRVQ